MYKNIEDYLRKNKDLTCDFMIRVTNDNEDNSLHGYIHPYDKNGDTEFFSIESDDNCSYSVITLIPSENCLI